MARPKIVVLGMMSRSPVPGVIYQTVHYLRGLHDLGFDVSYVEDHGMTPRLFFAPGVPDGWAAAATFVDRVLGDFGIAAPWAYHAEFGGGRHFGMSGAELSALYRSAALLLNLSGSTRPRREHAASGRLVYVETDPVEVQVQLAAGNQTTIEYLDAHAAYFTFGECYATPECGLPVSDRFEFWPTRQPVVLDLWDRPAPGAGTTFTTIGNWRQTHRNVELDGETYGWSKHLEFARFLDLPQETGAAFELALSSFGPDDAALLARHGWKLRAPFLGYDDLDGYRNFILSSAGEFTVAKDQNVRLRTGWFSDRSATYLAAGRPVITQDTGFGAHLPTGKGLFPFRDLADAAAAVDEVLTNPQLHRRAAREIAVEHFAAPVVLTELLDRVGLAPPRPSRPRAQFGLPADLPVQPASRWPTTLAETAASLMDVRVRARIREASGRRALAPTGDAAPEVSVVIVTHGGAAFTAMCMESLLGDTDVPPMEVVVVDNASPDDTPKLLDAYARLDPRVRVLPQVENLGFARGNNIGMAAARGRTIVLLNSDTVVPPGWLHALLPHLDDPSVGLVGPVTNRTSNEAEVDAPYRTVGQLRAFAVRRRDARRGESFAIPMLAMFCTAGRRSTFDRLGPLDEEYGVGMFEDEDYAARARAAGLRLICAEDAFVHHFGQASLGRVLDPVAYEETFSRNRSRFESRWQVRWQPHRRRPAGGYDELCRRVLARVEEVTPPGARVLVTAKGDDRLLELTDRAGGHFPGHRDGRFLGEYPSGSAAALDVLAVQQAGGFEYLVFPSTSAWWLDHYRGLAAHLEAGGPPVHRDDDCVVWRLPSGTSVLQRIVAAQSDELARLREEVATLRDLVAAEPAPAPATAPAPVTGPAAAPEAGIPGDVWEAVDRLMEEAGASKRTRYLAVRGRLKAAICELVPPGETVAIVSHGDDQLLALGGRTGWHLPRLPDGGWAGCNPADGRDAALHVQLAAALGAGYLALPGPYGWWLDHYRDLATHLERTATRLLADPAVGWLWSLRGAADGEPHGALHGLVQGARQRMADADPSILDWDSGLDVAAALPELAVFSPPVPDPTLPYLDATVDVVVLRGGSAAREAEAVRVASVAVALVDEAGAVRTRWLGAEPPPAGGDLDGSLVAVVRPGAIPLGGWRDVLRARLRNATVGAVTAPAAVSRSGATFDGRTAGPAVVLARRELVADLDGVDGDEGFEGLLARLGAARQAVVALDTPLAAIVGEER